MKTINDLLGARSLSEIEELLIDNKDSDYRLKGGEVSALLLLAKSITLSQLRREVIQSVEAREEAEQFVARLRRVQDDEQRGNT